MPAALSLRVLTTWSVLAAEILPGILRVKRLAWEREIVRRLKWYVDTPGSVRCRTGCILTLLLAAALACPDLVAAQQPSIIKSDETVTILPTAARLDPAGDNWVISLHAWVFERERDSFWRRSVIDDFVDWLDLPAGSEANQQFQERAGDFLVDNERRKSLTLSLDGRLDLELPKTADNGHAEGKADVPVADLPPGKGNPWLKAAVVLEHGDPRSFAGGVQLIAPEGPSVISDIDDTIKISHVTDKRRLLEYSFLRRFEPVPGMAEVYRSWQEGGAVFHYVSSSPWQLYPALADFMSSADFPSGSYHLRYLRLWDDSFFNLFTSSEQSKPPVIDDLLEAYPRRDFVLVGDSGERDPEIYGNIARAHPGRISHIYIRLVTPEHRDHPRMQAAFASLPEDLWSLFENPSDLTMSTAGK
jgi:hypothetical protein